MAFGVEPVFPFDLHEATFLAPGFGVSLLDTPTLVAIWTRQLQKRDADLEQMKQLVWRYRRKLAGYFEDQNQHVIKSFDFKPGKLVLVHNSAEDSGLKNKYLPRYLGPFVVVRRNQGGAYILAEMDGSISHQRFAAKRLIPYFLRSAAVLPLPNADLGAINTPSHVNEQLYLSAYRPMVDTHLGSQVSLPVQHRTSDIPDSNARICR